MLVIKNIDRIIGLTCNGVDVIDVAQNVLKTRYTFRFDIPWVRSTHRGPVVEVVLERVPNSDGNYQLFVMGWQKVTFIYVDESDLRHAHFLADRIRTVLKKLQDWIESHK